MNLPGARPANSRTLRPVKGGWPTMFVEATSMRNGLLLFQDEGIV